MEVGAGVGVAVGLAVGVIVGAEVGLTVGVPAVGLAVGVKVGVDVGLVVGVGVVAASTSAAPPIQKSGSAVLLTATNTLLNQTVPLVAVQPEQEPDAVVKRKVNSPELAVGWVLGA